VSPSGAVLLLVVVAFGSSVAPSGLHGVSEVVGCGRFCVLGIVGSSLNCLLDDVHHQGQFYSRLGLGA
jgi:hypothetical protein